MSRMLALTLALFTPTFIEGVAIRPKARAVRGSILLSVEAAVLPAIQKATTTDAIADAVAEAVGVLAEDVTAKFQFETESRRLQSSSHQHVTIMYVVHCDDAKACSDTRTKVSKMSTKSIDSVISVVNQAGYNAGFNRKVVGMDSKQVLAEMGQPVFVDLIIPEKCGPASDLTIPVVVSGMEGLSNARTRMHMILDGNAACADINGCAGGKKCYGACRDVKAPGTGFTCAACPKGFSGDGKTCTPQACYRSKTDPPAGPCGWNAASCTDVSTKRSIVNLNVSQLYTCKCKMGYMEIQGKCIKSTVVARGSCKVSCWTSFLCGGAKCLRTPNFDTCKCPAGYTTSDSGKTCKNLNACARNPCFPGVTCTDIEAPGTGYKCYHPVSKNSCPPGFAVTTGGTQCKNIDDCKGTSSGTVCGSKAVASCKDTGILSYTCTCAKGHMQIGGKCVKTSPCNSFAKQECDPKATCNDMGAGKFECVCPAGDATYGRSNQIYTGSGLKSKGGCKNFDACITKPCYPTVQCQDVAAPGFGYKCVGGCPKGFEAAGSGSLWECFNGKDNDCMPGDAAKGQPGCKRIDGQPSSIANFYKTSSSTIKSSCGSTDLEAYYSFNDETSDDTSGHYRDGKWQGTEKYGAGPSGMGKAAVFDGKSRIFIDKFKDVKYGKKFAVSLWFKRTSSAGYQGVLNNGYDSHGSWEVRMGNENGGTMLGGGIRTQGHSPSWDHVGLKAALNGWHHVAMTYNGSQLDFYLDGVKSLASAKDSGNISFVKNSVFIGQAGTGTSGEYFTGAIDEVRIFKRTISTKEIATFCNCKIVIPPPPPPPAKAKGGTEGGYDFNGKNLDDASGMRRYGKWEGSASYLPGKQGSGAFFDGKSRILYKDYSGFKFGKKVSIDFWVRTTSKASGSSGVGLVNNGFGSSGSIQIMLYPASGRPGTASISAGVQTTGSMTWTTVRFTEKKPASPPPPGFNTGAYGTLDNWHHVALLYNGKGLELYVDGTRAPVVPSLTGDVKAVNNGVYVGQAGVGTSGKNLLGMIDELKITTTPMNRNQIKAACSCSITIPPPPPPPAVAKGGLEAHYSFDKSNTDDSSGNRRHGKWAGNANYATGKVGTAAVFDGSSKIHVDWFKGMKWTDKFSVSLWFKRTGQTGNYQGIVNNGYNSHGSFEIRMGRENGGTMLGGGILTQGHAKAWDHSGITAKLNDWHHVAMVYDGKVLNFYVDGKKEKDSAKDSGKIVTKNTPLTIGQAGPGTSQEFFYGLIDEVKIYTKALSETEIAQDCKCSIKLPCASGFRQTTYKDGNNVQQKAYCALNIGPTFADNVKACTSAKTKEQEIVDFTKKLVSSLKLM